jgi:putative hemolysin
MPDVDLRLPQIARLKGFAAAMIDAAMRKRFELMVAEFHRELDAIDEDPVCQRDNDKN